MYHVIPVVKVWTTKKHGQGDFITQSLTRFAYLSAYLYRFGLMECPHCEEWVDDVEHCQSELMGKYKLGSQGALYDTGASKFFER